MIESSLDEVESFRFKIKSIFEKNHEERMRKTGKFLFAEKLH